jgi:hypothetical protein
MTPLQIGFAGSKAQLFPAETKVVGLRLNLALSDNQDVMGWMSACSARRAGWMPSN